MQMCVELMDIIYNGYIALEIQHSQVGTDRLILTPNTTQYIK